MEDLCLEQLTKDAAKFVETLETGKMLVVRTRDDFIYILDAGATYQMFSHTAGQPRAGRRVQSKEQTASDMFEQMAKVVDTAFSVGFDKAMDLPTVMYSAEEAILQTFPMVGEEEKLDFSAYNKPVQE